MLKLLLIKSENSSDQPHILIYFAVAYFHPEIFLFLLLDTLNRIKMVDILNTFFFEENVGI